MSEIKHYGTKRHSGRYPWGSGDDPEQRSGTFLNDVRKLREQGMSDLEIARARGMNSTEFRKKLSVATDAEKAANISMAVRLKAKGLSNTAIGDRMGTNESTVRSWLKQSEKDRANITISTANMLREQLDKQGSLDIGLGVESHIGISRTKLLTAVSLLEEEGYPIHKFQLNQLGTNKKTWMMILAKPGTEWADVVHNKDKIGSLIPMRSIDGGRSYLGLKPIQNVDQKRLKVRYAEENGYQKDGVIELRPGVKDLSLGNARYAQVRIGVDGTHYLKGMAMYGKAEDFPPGVDMIFNTNKSNTGNKLDALKKMERKKDGTIDEANPFGATIKHGGQKGALNIVNEEEDWSKWDKNLPAQFLSKQKPAFVKKQLDEALAIKKKELEDTMALTNPEIKKKLLLSLSDDLDSSAVHLKAAAIPRQATHVILPFPDMKETDIYAPRYTDGERVALVRFPHGGTFEIAELTVNNKHKRASELLGKDAKDAVGINHKVAERLSGADFDGDFVLVIPNNNRLVTSSPALKGLENFDPKAAYPKYDNMPEMTKRQRGMEMGNVSNLITDMSIKGAPPEHLARAVRHSMVVIDAYKHHLNYKQSAIDNGIADLKTKYQGSARAGASTLISRSTSVA